MEDLLGFKRDTDGGTLGAKACFMITEERHRRLNARSEDLVDVKREAPTMERSVRSHKDNESADSALLS